MTSDARGLLDYVIANPDDDAPRLVFADWFEEHGDAARAEFVRVQCERARLPEWDGRRVRLEVREAELLRDHEGRWRAELPAVQGMTWGEFRRGFVGAVTFKAFAAFRAGAAETWRAAPVEAVSVRWPKRRDSVAKVTPPGLRELSLTGTVVDSADVERLAAAPLLSTLRVLSARHCHLGVEVFRRLVASPHLGRLEALRVPLNGIGNGGIPALASATALTSLTELNLSEAAEYGRYGEDPQVTTSGMEELAAWPGLARLRSLDLSGSDGGRAGLRALLASPHSVGLKSLNLFDSGVSAETAEEFSAARPGLRLDALNLMQNELNGGGVERLGRAACLSELKVLNLGRCGLSPADTRALAGAPFLAGLRELNLEFNDIGDQGLVALLGGSPRELHTLSLERNELGYDDSAGVRVLTESPAARSLLRLNVRRNYLRDAGARALAESPHLDNLLVLQSSLWGVSESVAEQLEQSPLGRRVGLTVPRAARLNDGGDASS